MTVDVGFHVNILPPPSFHSGPKISFLIHYKKIPVVELLRESASGSETTGSLPISILSQKGKSSGLGRKGLKPMKNIQHKRVLVLTLIHMWLTFSLSLTHSYLKTPKRKNSLMLFQGKASKKFRNFIERDFFSSPFPLLIFYVEGTLTWSRGTFQTQALFLHLST